MATNWTGERWAGGRIALSNSRKVYYIERSLGGRGERKRITFCLGSLTPDQALSELSRYNDDPQSYLPPEARKEAARNSVEDRRKAAEAAAVILTEKRIADFADALAGTEVPVPKYISSGV